MRMGSIVDYFGNLTTDQWIGIGKFVLAIGAAVIGLGGVL